MAIVLTNFRALLPAHCSSQLESLSWLSAAHARGEAEKARSAGSELDELEFRRRISRLLTRVGCGEDKIRTRGHELLDLGHTRWAEMEVYPLNRQPNGAGSQVRTEVFSRIANGIFQRFYAEDDTPPDEILHVTCTGYSSPSAAQQLLSRRSWGAASRVTHVYHMGCYASLPAIRIAAGLCTSPLRSGSRRSSRAEIVHTEVCSLHINPLLHTAEQLVVESLFADGFIKYAVQAEVGSRAQASLSVLAMREELVSDSTNAMGWFCSDFGLRMVLSRDVPELIAAALSNFVKQLGNEAGLSANEREQAVYAVHPGGPRILDRVERVLGLSEEQLEHSRSILREYGNMSSATLPHIWMRILDDDRIGTGKAIVCLAFGPGLTLWGAVLRKIAN